MWKGAESSMLHQKEDFQIKIYLRVVLTVSCPSGNHLLLHRFKFSYKRWKVLFILFYGFSSKGQSYMIKVKFIKPIIMSDLESSCHVKSQGESCVV